MKLNCHLSENDATMFTLNTSLLPKEGDRMKIGCMEYIFVKAYNHTYTKEDTEGKEFTLDSVDIIII